MVMGTCKNERDWALAKRLGKLLFRLLQGLFGQFALRDVDGHAQHAGCFAIRSIIKFAASRNPARTAARSDQPELGDKRLTPFFRMLQSRGNPLPIFWVYVIRKLAELRGQGAKGNSEHVLQSARPGGTALLQINVPTDRIGSLHRKM